MEVLGPVQTLLCVGDYGSGKTEIAVNLALHQQAAGRKVAIADLDLVNPYFRCREAREPLEAAGVRVIMPQGAHEFADLPILLPQIKGLLGGLLGDPSVLSIFDVGGDTAGSRVLSALAPVIVPPRGQFWFVVNGRRPFCDTPEGVLTAIRRVEESSGLRVTGLIANTHLMSETTAEMVVAGVHMAEEVGKRLGVSVELVTAMEPIAASLPAGAFTAPLLPLRRLMVPPWVRRGPARPGPAAFRPGTQR